MFVADASTTEWGLPGHDVSRQVGKDLPFAALSGDIPSPGVQCARPVRG
jgi:hypothetical protein